MMNRTSLRLLALSTVLVLATGLLARWSAHEKLRLPAPLETLPMQIGGWNGNRQPAFDPKLIQNLGVDDYVNRSYVAPTGTPVLLYVGFYGDQRSGRTSHSPLKCLPSNGWEPTAIGRTVIRVRAPSGSRDLDINRYVVQKGTEQQLVLFWYQSRGRVIASEYWAKFYLVNDAVRFNRTDGALVRIIVPLGSDSAAQERAAKSFIEQLFPVLGRYLPV